ncbi:uncharacterized protein LOC105212043 [Zeugodacus cucurbitae]|nr:uncharacterized protein LOC105212043 [Zeugodacus cucurbitae]
MWSKTKSIQIIWALLLIQLVAAGTTRHGTRSEDPADHSTSDNVDADGYQTFTRQGVTLHIKPHSRTIQIGGDNASPEQLLEQARQAKQLDILAVRQLLNTRHPVKRTTFENGHKQTSTYTLESDGSILCKIVEDIDMADVDRRFEDIFKQQREKQAKEQPNKLNDWEWSDDYDEPAPSVFKAPLQPFPAGQPYVPTPPQSPQPAEQQPSFYKPTRLEPAWPASDRVPTPPQSRQPAEQQPNVYKPTRLQPAWPAPDEDDPFNPPGLPVFNNFADDKDDLDTYDKPASTPVGKTNTITKTNTDKDGNKVYTSTTLMTAPNEWNRKTVKISTNKQFRPNAEPNLPDLDDFLREQYNPSPKGKPESAVPSLTTSTTPRTIKTIKIEDLPPVAVLNVNKPVHEQFLQPLTPNAAADQRPIKTLHVDNILPSSVPDTDRYERTKVQTLTKTITGNQIPTAADLDPKMLDMLQRAGIKPEDIAKADGQTITKTRTEPDGRIVTTTYHIKRTNHGQNPEPSSFFLPRDWRRTFEIPPSRNHKSASHFGVDFSPFIAGSVGATITTSTTARPLIRDREPLEPQVEDDEVAATLNPLLIHPVQPAVSASAKSPIADFLAKFGLSVADVNANRGEYVKTIVDPDGSVLTARFRLTGKIAHSFK